MLLATAAFFTALAVQPGELGSVDTVRRLQTAHAFWTDAPSVDPGDEPGFGTVGRNGRLYAGFGMGQSLLMLPFDILSAELSERVPYLRDRWALTPMWRWSLIAYPISTLLAVLTMLVCFRFLRALEFNVRQAVAGCLTLLFATTFLHYTQVMQENNYLLLLTLTGLCFQFEWARTQSRKALLCGALACGLNLLTRLTTAMDWAGCVLFLLLYLHWSGVRGRGLAARAWEYVKIAGPVGLFFLGIDRGYQYYRFGTWFTTYVSVTVAQMRAVRPDLPPGFPFEGSLWNGVSGALLSAEKSIFLFDPMILITLAAAIWLGKRMAPAIRAYVVALSMMLMLYVLFYAKFTIWSGDWAWADRYTTMPVDLLGLLSVPLLFRYRARVPRLARELALGVLALSVAIQIESTVFRYVVEIFQMETRGHPTFVVGLRALNIVARLAGTTDEWGLSTAYTHANAIYYFPFLAMESGRFGAGFCQVALSVWCLLIVGLLATLWRIFANLSKDSPSSDIAASGQCVSGETSTNS